ncbi:helix-turn-helix transcriptional regulator [Spongiibacter sp.]|uniref:helix-turn-helix transcriptional regulator n=1 Tax=Spongiibacter sp. TaxID=2024860 RepID=UPI00356A5351
MSDLSVSPRMDALLYALYSGTLETPPWQGFLDQLRDLMGGNYATLLLRPPNEHEPGVVLNALVVSPEIYRAYNETYFALDPFVNLPDGEVVTVAEYMSAEEFESSEYYRNYIEPSNIRHILGADLWQGERLLGRLRVTRPASRDNFGEREKALCKSLLRHIKQAVEIHSRLRESESERAFYANTIDSLSVGVLTLDAAGKVLHSNPVALRLLAQQRGIAMQGVRLSFRDQREQQGFKELLAEVIDAHHRREAGCVRAFRLADAHSLSGLSLLLRPLPHSDHGSDQRPAVAVFVSDPMAPRQAPSDVLIELFGLTPAESKLAIRLVNGQSLDEASESLNISRNTAKSHLSSVFSKTGVARQTQLIQLILNSVVTLAGAPASDS